MPSRLTYLFQITTEAVRADLARPHTGGWSESIWRPGESTTIQSIQSIAVFRGAILPVQAAIVGYRQQVFTLDGNRLVAGGASTGTLNQPGARGFECDLPQVALECKLMSDGKPNVGKIVLRGIPDSQMVSGEYAPQVPFQNGVRNYLGIIGRIGCQFLGRKLTNGTVRVNSIAAGVITTDAATGAAAGDYLRLLRVRDTFGRPVSGTFRVTAVNGFAYTVAGMDAEIVVLNSGRVRKDELELFPISSHETGRARVKKIGRPFETYRGRASKRRTA